MWDQRPLLVALMNFCCFPETLTPNCWMLIANSVVIVDLLLYLLNDYYSAGISSVHDPYVGNEVVVVIGLGKILLF